MIHNSKTKNIVLVICAAFICLFLVLYILKKTNITLKREQPEDNRIVSSQSSSNDSGDQSSINTDESSKMLPEENEEVYFERIEDLEYLPLSIYFRKFTFVLKDCWYSKDLCGQPEVISNSGYEDLEIANDGKILSDHSYLHVTFSLKNETDQEIVRFLNTSRLYINSLLEHYTESIAEMAAMNLPSQQEDARYYYKWAFAPYEETEFTVTFLLRDQYLGDDYSLYYFYCPEGRTDYKIVNGQEVTISDAKYILLDHVLRAEGEERKNDQEIDGTSSGSSQNKSGKNEPSDSSNEENTKPVREIHFWEPGEEEVEIVADTHEGQAFTCATFQNQIYLRDFTHLKELAQLYDLEKDAPLIEFCSPFDGSAPIYIKIPGGGYQTAESHFPMPWEEDAELVISQSWFGIGIGNSCEEDILKEYMWYENNTDQRIRESVKLYRGEIPVLSYHLDRRYGGEYDGYLLEWVYNGILLQITDLPEKAIIDDPELLETLVEYIQNGRYIKNGSESSE